MPLPLTPSEYMALMTKDTPLGMGAIVTIGMWELHRETFEIHRDWPDIKEEKG